MARKCPQCGSRKWRKDAISGSVVCEDGHVLAGVRSENLVSEPTGHVMQKRKATRGPRVSKWEDGRANKDFFHGQAAEFLRLQGLQLLLRHQIAALKRLWSLPDAFEIVVRELWTYRLLSAPLPSQDVDSRPPSPMKRDVTAKGKPSEFVDDKDGGKKGTDEDDGSDDESDSGRSDSSDRTAKGAKDDVDADLLAHLSEDSDADQIQIEAEDNGDKAAKPRRRRVRNSDTLVCLVLGLWLLRIPFTHADLESMVNTNEVPYVDFGHSTLVPEEMSKHMNREVRFSLSPRRCPTPTSLYAISRQFAQLLTRAYDQVIPEVNVQPLAWYVIYQLGGTAVTHAQTMRFLHLIDNNMSLTDIQPAVFSKPRRNSESGRDTTEVHRSYSDIIMPELSIVAAWVVVMKLAYGLDGQDRLALLRADPLVGMPPGNMWIDELSKRVKSGVLKGSRRDMERTKFDLLDSLDIDRFLDRAESVLVKDRDFGTGAHLTQFPLHKVNPAPAPEPPVNSWKEFHADASSHSVRPTPPRTDSRELPLMPGEKYRKYDSSDVTGELPHAFETVLQAAADLISVPVELVAQTVEMFERRIDKSNLWKVPPEKDATPTFMRVRNSGLRESRSLDQALNELGAN